METLTTFLLQIVLPVVGLVVSVMLMIVPFVISAKLSKILEEQERAHRVTEYRLKQIEAILTKLAAGQKRHPNDTL